MTFLVQKEWIENGVVDTKRKPRFYVNRIKGFSENRKRAKMFDTYNEALEVCERARNRSRYEFSKNENLTGWDYTVEEL